jgi:hypothetical protein
MSTETQLLVSDRQWPYFGDSGQEGLASWIVIMGPSG